MVIRSDKRALVFARFPNVIGRAARRYQRVTGLTVVTTLNPVSPDKQTWGPLTPPVHPLCARLLRRLPGASPCDEEWHKHLQFAARTRGSRIHTCRLGLRCAGVTIALGDELLGLAKCVCGPEITPGRFRSCVRLLEDMIVRPCLELQDALLRDEIRVLHAEVNRLRRVKRPVPLGDTSVDLPAAKDRDGAGAPGDQSLISQVLDYLREHFADSDLSLARVATAAGKNEKYVTHLFSQQVGERMRTYITRLRVRCACELLLQTNSSIEAVASGSGFAHPAQFRHSFRRAVGVTASEYRRIFAPAAI
jgi:AraC-like DNA-binding protein